MDYTQSLVIGIYKLNALQTDCRVTLKNILSINVSPKHLNNCCVHLLSSNVQLITFYILSDTQMLRNYYFLLTLFCKITSINWFWSNFSLEWKSANSPISVLNTLGVAYLGNIGPEPQYPFLIRILTTAKCFCRSFLPPL